MSFVQRETWRISRGDAGDAVDCPFCSVVTPMIAAETLARLAGISPRDVYRRVEEGCLHFIETPKMELLVCLNSFSENTTKTSSDRSAVQRQLPIKDSN